MRNHKQKKEKKRGKEREEIKALKKQKVLSRIFHGRIIKWTQHIGVLTLAAVE